MRAARSAAPLASLGAKLPGGRPNVILHSCRAIVPHPCCKPHLLTPYVPVAACAVVRRFHAGIPMEKVITNLDEYGNTSAGSIPIALDQAVREGK